MSSPQALPGRVAQIVVLEAQPNGVTVRLVYSVATPLGLQVHMGARDAAASLLMRRSGGVVSSDRRSCHFPASEQEQAFELARNLRAALLRVSRRPLSPRQVEALLGITPAERRCWCETGRLVRSGQAQIRSGRNKIAIWTYSVEAIEALIRDPAQTQRWRDQLGGSARRPLAAISTSG